METLEMHAFWHSRTVIEGLVALDGLGWTHIGKQIEFLAKREVQRLVALACTSEMNLKTCDNSRLGMLTVTE